MNTPIYDKDITAPLVTRWLALTAPTDLAQMPVDAHLD